jgi:iron-sulfur cluster repair protein YtfE (RIC family)
MNKSIKIYNEIRLFNEEHYQNLMLSWKIRKGFVLEVSMERIDAYVQWYFVKYVLPHFEKEEKFVFPLLGFDNELVKRAMGDHRRLRRLFTSKSNLERKLSLIEEEFELHIRFEEKILFTEIQSLVPRNELEMLVEKLKAQTFEENTLDQFWKNNKKEKS